jgi:integrase/recombinase XerD
MLKPIPEVFIVEAVNKADKLPQTADCIDLRKVRIDEFLSARSLADKTKKAYRQDLKYFQDWTDTRWADLTPKMVAKYKDYLLRVDSETKKRVLSDASVRRILGTLQNFYDWMLRSGYVKTDPTIAVELPSLKEPEAKNLSDEAVKKILSAIAQTSLPERNLALMAVLSHGLRPGEPSNLDVGDYDGIRLHIRIAKHDSKGFVPLDNWAQEMLNNYLQWRQSFGETLNSDSPLFLSHSRRNAGERMSYDTVRKLVEKIREEIGFYFHAHQLRHTFATNLVIDGMNPYHVMTLTRHKSVNNFRRYTKAADQAAAENAYFEHLQNKAHAKKK